MFTSSAVPRHRLGGYSIETATVPAAVPDDVRWRRFFYAKAKAKAAPYQSGTVGPRSKTGNAKCSEAVSRWARHQASPADHKQLAQCRAMTKGATQAKHLRAAGKEGRAQHIEHRIAKGGPLTGPTRHVEALERLAERQRKTTEAKRGTTAAATRIGGG